MMKVNKYRRLKKIYMKEEAHENKHITLDVDKSIKIFDFETKVFQIL
jgi:hypothetical protein